MTRAKDISKIVTDANFSGTLDVAGAFTSLGIDDNATSTAITIDSSENVGIGETLPFAKLHISDTQTGRTSAGSTGNLLVLEDDNNGMSILSSNSGQGHILFGDVDDAASGGIAYDHSTNRLRFRVNSAWDPMVIDSAGNMGIGITSLDNTYSASHAIQIASVTDNNWGGTLMLTSADGSSVFSRLVASTDGLDLINTKNTNMRFFTNNTERMRIDSSGNVGIGTSSPTGKLDISGGTTYQPHLRITNSAGGGRTFGLNVGVAALSNAYFAIKDETANAYRFVIDDSGNAMVGKTSNSHSTAGFGVTAGGQGNFVASSTSPLILNRLTNDGSVVSIRQANTEEGNISVSGTTVSYNGGHLSRWSQLADNTRDTTILKGTVMTNLDQMAEWTTDGVTEDNEQLNCMAISSVEGDANVAGVFVNWDNDDDIYTNDMNIAMTGDMVIRIAQGTTVARGDLLISAGDGTAKTQSDDIVRSKTIAKVTSTNVSHTYEDGTYLVPCVLMAC